MELSSQQKFSQAQKVGLALVFIFLLMRFCFLDLSPFIGDEPAIQMTIDHALSQGRFPWIGHESTFGAIRHPGLAFWIYRFTRFFNDEPWAMSLTQVLFSTFGIVGVMVAIFRSHLKVNGAIIFGFLAFSSPYLFYYSRLPWDNNFQVFSLGLFIFLTSILKKESFINGFLLGVSIGVIANVHLMAASSVLAAIICTLIFYKKIKTRLGVLMGFSTLIAPFLIYGLSGAISRNSSVDHSQWSIRSILYDLRAVTWYLSADRFGYFMDGTLRPLKAWIGKPFGLFFEFDYAFVLRVIVILGAFFGTVFGAIFASNTLSSKARFLDSFAVFSILSLLIFYRFAHPDFDQPHYYLPLWWIGFYFATSGILLLKFKTNNKKIRTFLFGAVGITVLGNAATVYGFLRQIDANQGTTAVHTSTLPRAFKKSIELVCNRVSIGRLPEISLVCIDTSKTKGLLDSPFHYFFSRLIACEGRHAYIANQDHPWPPICEDPNKAMRFETVYLDGTARFEIKALK